MRCTTLMLLLAVCGPSAFADEIRWQEFASKEGRFTVLLPGKPMQDEVETESDFGKSTLHFNTVTVGDVFYTANYSDFAPEIEKTPVAELMKASRNGAVANLEGKLVSEKDIKLGEFPGREFQIAVPGDRIFRARIYLVKRRLYQMVVLGTKEEATSKDADQFLDSFKLAE